MDDFGLKVGRYNSTLPTLVDGQPVELQVDQNGKLLVQADVSVVIDFLGLNGASDNSNILMVGTEDGTALGTAHALRLAADGSVAVQDNGGSLTVDAVDLDIRDLAFATDKVDVTGSDVTATVTATDLDIRDLNSAQDSVSAVQSGVWSVQVSDGVDTLAVNADGSVNAVVSATDLDIRDLNSATDSVTVVASDLDIRDLAFATDKVDVTGSDVTATVSATDLDIRDLSAAQDNVAISDGTDTLAINADGSINVIAQSAPAGTEAHVSSDPTGDGLVQVPSTTFVTVASLSLGAGEAARIYGWSFDSDQNVTARLVVVDSGTPVEFLSVKVNSSAMPGREEHYSESGRIELVGAAGRTVQVQVAKRSPGGGSANASGAIHARKI